MTFQGASSVVLRDARDRRTTRIIAKNARQLEKSFPSSWVGCVRWHARFFEVTSAKDAPPSEIRRLPYNNPLFLGSSTGSPSPRSIEPWRPTITKCLASSSSSATAIDKAFIKARQRTLRLPHKSRPWVTYVISSLKPDPR